MTERSEKSEKTEKAFQPVTFWLAGPEPLYPNPRIRIPNTHQRIHFRKGHATVTSQQEYDLVKQALGDTVYEEDIAKTTSLKGCQTCGYAPRSSGARDAHDTCHPPVI